jgi:hypothetical protein
MIGEWNGTCLSKISIHRFSNSLTRVDMKWQLSRPHKMKGSIAVAKPDDQPIVGRKSRIKGCTTAFPFGKEKRLSFREGPGDNHAADG